MRKFAPTILPEVEEAERVFVEQSECGRAAAFLSPPRVVPPRRRNAREPTQV